MEKTAHEKDVEKLQSMTDELIQVVAASENETLMDLFDKWMEQRNVCNEGYLDHLKSLIEESETGVSLIAKERREQIEKHGRTIENDVELNVDSQLGVAACVLAYPDIEETDYRHEAPQGWNLEIWQKMYDKPYKDRLIIAGALIAAEIDRINRLGD